MWLRLQCCAYLLLATFFFTPLTAVADNACSISEPDDTASIKYVHDGDTLHLGDGRKVRLIGINTPEVARGKQPAQLYSAEAKSALQALFKDDRTILLSYGREQQDKYQRTLAHGFTQGGDNIQAALLTQGYAQAITFPPNTRLSECYHAREREARCNKRGLWKKNQVITSKKLDDTHIGFRLVKGKLKDIKINKKGFWLNLDNKITIGIRPENYPLFDLNKLNKMLNQPIIVRGWLNRSKKDVPYYIRVRHPSALQLATEFACG